MEFFDFRGKPVRITRERMEHMYRHHPELKEGMHYIEETITSPEMIQEGRKDELLAIKLFDRTPVSRNKYAVVVYTNRYEDDFIITAYFTRRPSTRRKILWRI